MKRLSLTLFSVLLACLPLSSQIQGQWTSTGTMQFAREHNAQVRIANGRVLSLGGIDNSGNVLSSAEVYSVASGNWTATTSMTEPRAYFSAVVLGNGKVLVAGGLSTNGLVLGNSELYDPATATWTPAGSLSVPRLAHTGALLPSGEVLIAGGCTDSNCSTDTAVSEVYDPASNSWSTTGSLNSSRHFHTAVSLKTGKVLAVGGAPGLTSCELYDPTKRVWTNAATMTIGRYLNTITLLTDGKVLAAGGASGRYPISSAEIYNPATNTWSSTGAMTSGRYAHAATLLGDGTVVVAGGIGQSISCGKACTGYIPTNKVDIFNETTDTFAAGTPLSHSLAYQSMTLLSTGRALEDGGSATTATCCVVTASSSFYTPLTLKFTAASLNFGLLQIGLSSPAQIVTVTNISTHSVSFTSIAASGDFSQAHSCPSTMLAGQSCTITVSFTPTASGTRNGTITLKDNSPGSPVQTIALTGVGEPLALGFTPSSINFGGVLVGSTLTTNATLRNDGASPVTIGKTTISPANATYTESNNCSGTLAVQQSCTITIVFTPPDVFTYKATLSVTNSAGSAATLLLTGTGLEN